MSDILTADLFSPHVGELFQVGDTELSLTLVAVEVDETAQVPYRTPFTLIFRGPATPWAPEKIWPLRAPDGTVREIYISPIHTPASDRQDYQAVFN